jgi:hypothetical protein
LVSTATSWRDAADAAHPATTTAVRRLNRIDLILYIVYLLGVEQTGFFRSAALFRTMVGSTSVMAMKG